MTLALFDPEKPGFGVDTLDRVTPVDQPMAYALYASAEAMRFLASSDPTASQNALRAALWLVENAHLAGNGDAGWGLPQAWDAFADGSTNPPHTVYGITTALGIKALLDVVDMCAGIQRSNEVYPCTLLVETALRAAQTFVQGCFDLDEAADELVFWYSHLPEDSYHVLNVSSMLVGQVQRLSRYVVSKELSSFLNHMADRGVRYILRRARFDECGTPYWYYLGDRRPSGAVMRPNDLVHESYTILGLVEYVAYGGCLGGSVELPTLLLSLGRFASPDDGRVYEFPRGWEPGDEEAHLKDRAARLWGTGYALFVASAIEIYLGLNPSISTPFLQNLPRYWDGQAWHLWPEAVSPLYPRQVAHVLEGLSGWLFARAAPVPRTQWEQSRREPSGQRQSHRPSVGYHAAGMPRCGSVGRQWTMTGPLMLLRRREGHPPFRLEGCLTGSCNCFDRLGLRGQGAPREGMKLLAFSNWPTTQRTRAVSMGDSDDPRS